MCLPFLSGLFCAQQFHDLLLRCESGKLTFPFVRLLITDDLPHNGERHFRDGGRMVLYCFSATAEQI